MRKTQSRIFLVSKGIITFKKFSEFNWEGMDESTKYLPLGAKIWAAKFANIFCGTVKIINLVGEFKSNLCPCCLKEVEINLHVLRCNHPDMTEAFSNKLKGNVKP